MRKGSAVANDLYGNNKAEWGNEMKLKADVLVEKAEGLKLRLGKKEKPVEEKDLEILELMEKGISDDDEMVRELAKKTGEDTISTGFRLAQFVEDYGDYLEAAIPSELYE